MPGDQSSDRNVGYENYIEMILKLEHILEAALSKSTVPRLTKTQNDSLAHNQFDSIYFYICKNAEERL